MIHSFIQLKFMRLCRIMWNFTAQRSAFYVILVRVLVIKSIRGSYLRYYFVRTTLISLTHWSESLVFRKTFIRNWLKLIKGQNFKWLFQTQLPLPNVPRSLRASLQRDRQEQRWAHRSARDTTRAWDETTEYSV